MRDQVLVLVLVLHPPLALALALGPPLALALALALARPPSSRRSCRRSWIRP